SLAEVVPAAESIAASGVRSILLFGIPAEKDSEGSSACDECGIVPRAVQMIRAAVPELAIFTDLCLCAYTDHGHCGLVREGGIDHGESNEALARAALAHAAAGADFVAPSAMLDGTVRVLRNALDGAGFTETGILSYSVKYASAFYGPFREAARSAPA